MIQFWLLWIFVAADGLSLVAVHRLLFVVASPVEHGLYAYRLGSCVWHVGPSQTGNPTHIPCIGRQILNHCAPREVLKAFSVGHFQRIIRNLLKKLTQLSPGRCKASWQCWAFCDERNTPIRTEPRSGKSRSDFYKQILPNQHTIQTKAVLLTLSWPIPGNVWRQ